MTKLAVKKWDDLIISPQDDLEFLLSPSRWDGCFVDIKRYEEKTLESAVFYRAPTNKTYILYAVINEVVDQHKKGLLRSEVATAEQAINNGWLVNYA